MGETFYKRMWFIATFYNVVGGIGIFILGPWVFSLAGEAVPTPPLYYQAWIAMFATIGVGYWFVYRDLSKNRDVIIMGIIGKLAFATLCLINTFVYCWKFLDFQKKNYPK